MFDYYTDVLMRSAIALAYFGFLRCGEFTTTSKVFDPDTNVCLGDVVVQFNEACLILKASKTDPFRQGVSIAYFRVNCSLCPIEALEKFLQLRVRFANIPQTPLFLFKDYSHLTRAKFLELLHKTCERAGLNSNNYKGHSFRMGAATSAAARGLQDHLIQCLGRWRSDAYKTYVTVAKSSIKTAHDRLAMI